VAIAQTERRDPRQHHSREWPKPIQCASSRCRSGPSQACFRAGARRLHSAATSDLVRYSRESSFSRLGETPPYPASGQHLRQPVEEPDPKLESAVLHRSRRQRAGARLRLFRERAGQSRSFAAIWLGCPPLLRPPTRDIESSDGFRTMGSSDAFRTMELWSSMMVSATEFWRFPALQF
jgi:hypothetical protein